MSDDLQHDTDTQSNPVDDNDQITTEKKTSRKPRSKASVSDAAATASPRIAKVARTLSKTAAVVIEEGVTALKGLATEIGLAKTELSTWISEHDEPADNTLSGASGDGAQATPASHTESKAKNNMGALLSPKTDVTASGLDPAILFALSQGRLADPF